jgi:NADH-quinone oxidoreductase subunit A
VLDSEVLTAIVFGAVGFLFVLANLSLIGRFLRGRSLDYAEKGDVYECGEPAVGDARIRFNPRFLLLAIVFVLFDVEIAFLFPWGVAFKDAGIIAFWDMVVFLAILLVGYFWFWNLGELRWVLPQERESARESAHK